MGMIANFGLVNPENIFLIFIGLVWLIGAVMQDLKRREVDNIWNFSLIAFVLAYRAAVSVLNRDYWFILDGLLGLLIFIALGNLFYYGRLFAGGDAKLLISLGTVLPLSYNWITNLELFGIFILLFLAGGSVYAIVYSLVLVIFNRRRFASEFMKYFRAYRKMILLGLIFFVLWIAIAYFIDIKLILIGIAVLLFPIMFVFAKAIEEGCLVMAVEPKAVTVGDWLYRDVILGGKRLRANWEGVSPRQLALIRKSNKKILIKYGIPFTPSFLIALVVLIILF
jgi:hypothetical protein